MSSQVKSGKAFEYALIKQFARYLQSRNLPFALLKDSSFALARSYYEEFATAEQTTLTKAASQAVAFFPDVEPMLTYQKKNSKVDLSLAQDSAGQKGDVRDVIIRIDQENWEIGISAKNNHKAVKHPRLSGKIDFGKQWLNKPVSKEYFETVRSLFEPLSEIKKKIQRQNGMNSEIYTKAITGHFSSRSKMNFSGLILNTLMKFPPC